MSLLPERPSFTVMEPKEIHAKTCPFCGTGRYLKVSETEPDSDVNQYRIRCDASKGGCGAANGFQASVEAAIRDWNTRYTALD